MGRVFVVLAAVLEVWVLCAFARAILSWFPLGYDSAWSRINHVLMRITEPLIAPVRRLIGPITMGGVGLDLAFIIVVFGIQIVAIPLLRRFG